MQRAETATAAGAASVTDMGGGHEERACFAAPLLLFADAADALDPCALGKQAVVSH